MSLFRSFSEVVSTLLERLKLTQPNLDTKPGSVARDLFIDAQAEQIEKLYRTLSIVSEKQSLISASGKDLDRLAANFDITRTAGAQASGVVVATTNDISTDIPIPDGSIVTARSGATFKIIGNYIMSSAEKSKFSANASRLRKQLNVAGISDSYAIELPAQAIRSGISGNIGSLQIVSSNLQNGLKVVNLSAFSGGTNQEGDTSFRSRILSVFSGSNTGTSAGYRNAALGVTGVLDALVVEPGNTLMLRDGTETIEVNDGTFRILNSGSGGKVDIYVMGKQLEEVSESFTYSDKSGTGDASDDRNDITLGLSGIDNTLTSEERRLLAFKNQTIPSQPINAISSITGTKSGLLIESYIKDDGSIGGNYELSKDVNPETGGSPFGYDKVHFISSEKDVSAESKNKGKLNSIDPLKFTEVSDINDVYYDTPILEENSSVLASNRSIVYLHHKPVVKVSRIKNRTTGEIYTIESQNINSSSGLNDDGTITISGGTLPTAADILSVDYIWRHKYDPHTDFNGTEHSPSIFRDSDVADSIDWGVSNAIFEEESIIDKTDDGFEYIISTQFNISRIISVYSKTISTSSVINTVNSSGSSVLGIELDSDQDEIDNILSIKTNSGVECYNTRAFDGTFSSRMIYLPSDTPVSIGQSVVVHFNSIELYDVEATDASSSSNIITLPSTDLLEQLEILDTVDDLYATENPVYIKYIADIVYVAPSSSLLSLPIQGTSTSNNLYDSSFSLIDDSNQPVIFKYDDNENIEEITRFAPSVLSLVTSGTSKSGKIKVTGTTLYKLKITSASGLIRSGLSFNISSELKKYFGISAIPNSMSIARIIDVSVVNDDLTIDQQFDIVGYSISSNDFDINSASQNSNLKGWEFELPQTDINSNIATSSGDLISISIYISMSNDYDEVYFPKDGERITSKVFARIDRISITSGFRSASGSIPGSLIVKNLSQPGEGSLYNSDYKFSCPKEGERLTIKYTVNRLIADATAEIESVRPITADVLVKEAAELKVDVIGTLLINDDVVNNTDSIIEDVNNVITNLLNSTRLGTIVDYSDIISAATSVSGIDSINISTFNEGGNTGKKTFIKALDNQYISPGTIQFEAVARKDFRLT